MSQCFSSKNNTTFLHTQEIHLNANLWAENIFRHWIQHLRLSGRFIYFSIRVLVAENKSGNCCLFIGMTYMLLRILADTSILYWERLENSPPLQPETTKAGWRCFHWLYPSDRFHYCIFACACRRWHFVWGSTVTDWTKYLLHANGGGQRSGCGARQGPHLNHLV